MFGGRFGACGVAGPPAAGGRVGVGAAGSGDGGREGRHGARTRLSRCGKSAVETVLGTVRVQMARVQMARQARPGVRLGDWFDDYRNDRLAA